MQKKYICFTCYKAHPEMKGVSEKEFNAGNNICTQEKCPIKGKSFEEAYECEKCGKLYHIHEKHIHDISYEDFAKLEIKIGKIIACEKIENTDKLLKLTVDVGEEQPRTIVSGIAEWYTPEDLVGKLCPFLVNLEPRKLRGVESQGMILAAGTDNRAILLHPDQEIPEGSIVK